MTGPTVLIDGLNCFLRNYARSPYMNAHGERAGGLAGTIISVRKIINDSRAANALVVWDGEGGSQRRKAIFSNYKANRSVRLNKRDDDMEEDPEAQLANLRKQVTDAREYLSLLGVPQVRCDGVEADDVMAYVAASVSGAPGGYVIVTTDQDLLQLVRERTRTCPTAAQEYHTDSACPECTVSSEIKVLSPVKHVMYDRRRFISDYGVLPENFALVKALTGDSSDNIAGVRGFGIKTVVKSFPFLAERKATADEVMAAAATLKGALGKRLLESESVFRGNLTLVDLSEPMLSATAARQARDALRNDLGCREVEFRMRLVRDGVSFQGDNFVAPFRELVLRRRHLLGELYGKTHTEGDSE